jgi:oxygen-dependent protoporphyrinogen oxidase
VRVAVIGGGLAGLAGALELVEGGAEVVLLEAGDRLGGQIRTTCERGFLVEEGADGFAPPQETLHRLIRDVRLDEHIVAPQALPTLVLEPPQDIRTAAPAEDLPSAAPARTLQGGMAELVVAIRRRIERKADLRIGNAAVALTRARPGWTVYPEIGAALVVDAILLALPARPAAWLVHPLTPDGARALSKLGTRPIVTVSAAYRKTSVGHPLNAAGIVLSRDPADDGVGLCAFVSSSFPGRAPADWVLLRALVRPARGKLVGTTDEGWTDAIHAELAPTLGLREPPGAAWVARWADASPVVNPQYHAHVAEARTALRAEGRIELVGAFSDGTGLEGALRSGIAGAKYLLGS